MPLGARPAALKHPCHLLPTLVLPRSGSSGRRHGSRPLSPVARAPVCIFVVHFTPARRLLSTPCLACAYGWWSNKDVEVDQPSHLVYPVGKLLRRFIYS